MGRRQVTKLSPKFLHISLAENFNFLMMKLSPKFLHIRLAGNFNFVIMKLSPDYFTHFPSRKFQLCYNETFPRLHF